MVKKTRWLALLLVLALLTGLLAGCGGQEQPQSDTGEQAPVADEQTAPANTDGNLVFTFFGNLEVPSSTNWGDCTLLTLPDGQRLLVDACEAGCETNIVRQLQDEGVTKINAAVISHYHSDHYGGLVSFIEAFGIETVYIDGIELDESLSWNDSASALRSYIDRLEAMDVEVITVLAGDSYEIGGVQMDILYPSPSTAGATTNDTSLVFTFTWEGQKALFASDLYFAGESICLKEVDNALLDADLLKIMHHGGTTSGSQEFIEAVSPKVAVAMGNHILTNLAKMRYEKVGCQVYEVWETGDVNVLFDGSDEPTVWTAQTAQ